MYVMCRELQEAHMGRGQPLITFEQGSNMIKIVCLKTPLGNVMKD